MTGCGITAARAGLSLVCFQVCLQSEEKAYYRLITSIISEIADAAREQAAAIEQINTGFEQMSDAVTTNSMTAQESAQSSEELANQAQNLKGLIGRFSLKDD